ncbi:MAG: 5-formyltetrahydrofolate cyclo-ligase [Polyangia bacterium]
MTERSSHVADLAAQKQELRRTLRAAREALPREVVDARSEEAAARLLALSLDGVRTIALYAGRRGELDPRVAAPALRARGISTVYPRVHAKPQLTFHTVTEAALALAAMDIFEPEADSTLAVHIDAYVVPGVGYTAAGDRLGNGGGYYDATLAASPSALRIGYAHDEQLVSSLPMGARDQRVDVLITPTRHIRCAPRPGAPVSSGAQP